MASSLGSTDPAPPVVPGSSTAPRAHPLQSEQGRSLPLYPKPPWQPVNSLRQAQNKCPSWQQVVKQAQQQLPPPSKVSHVSRAERFNHSFPRTFSSEQGLHCPARSLIFPSARSVLLSISQQTAQPHSVRGQPLPPPPLYLQPPSGPIKARKERKSEKKG